MPLKECLHRGCSVLVKGGSYCEAHNRHRTYQKHRQDTEYQAFYHSTAWRKVRAKVLARDRYICVECYKQGVITMANTVHHIIEIKDDWGKRLELDNLSSVCSSCHQLIHKDLR